MSESTGNFVEQRKFPRHPADELGPLVCNLESSSGKSLELRLTDISRSGFGADIPEYLGSHFSKGAEFLHCHINFPGIDDVAVRVVDLWMLRTRAGVTSMRAGFEFARLIDWPDAETGGGEPGL